MDILLRRLSRQPRGAGSLPPSLYSPSPPVEFFARGVGVQVAWLGGGPSVLPETASPAPHLTGICALILAKHPQLTPFQLKSVLFLTANNVGGAV